MARAVERDELEMPPRAARAIASCIPSSLPQISSAGTRSSAGTWDRSVHFDWKWAHDVDGGDKDNQLGDLGRGPAVGGEQHDPRPPCIPRRPHLGPDTAFKHGAVRRRHGHCFDAIGHGPAVRRPQSKNPITSATDH